MTPRLLLVSIRATERYDGPSQPEAARVSQVFYMTLRLFENMYDQQRKGDPEDEVWIGWQRRMLTCFARPGLQRGWRMRRPVFGEPFARFLEQKPLDLPIPSHAEVSLARSQAGGASMEGAET